MRIWYQTKGFVTGRCVTIWFIRPNLTKTETMTMIEYGHGLYYIDYDIKADGPYVGKVFEDGTPILSHVFRNGVCPGIVRKV